jgi:Uma2 family endonuclease
MELALDLNKRYTYADYLQWTDGKLRELLNGFIKRMSPAPKTIHQDINAHITTELMLKVRKHKGRCKVFPAPFDVRLPENGETADNEIYTVVQPDICVVCDLSKLDERGCLGAPDFIAEIQSLSTAKYDLNDKFHIYENAGVREYWVIIPKEGVHAFILQEDGKYDRGTLYEDGKIPVHIFGGEEIEVKEILGF